MSNRHFQSIDKFMEPFGNLQMHVWSQDGELQRVEFVPSYKSPTLENNIWSSLLFGDLRLKRKVIVDQDQVTFKQHHQKRYNHRDTGLFTDYDIKQVRKKSSSFKFMDVFDAQLYWDNTQSLVEFATKHSIEVLGQNADFFYLRRSDWFEYLGKFHNTYNYGIFIPDSSNPEYQKDTDEIPFTFSSIGTVIKPGSPRDLVIRLGMVGYDPINIRADWLIQPWDVSWEDEIYEKIAEIDKRIASQDYATPQDLKKLEATKGALGFLLFKDNPSYELISGNHIGPYKSIALLTNPMSDLMKPTSVMADVEEFKRMDQAGYGTPWHAVLNSEIRNDAMREIKKRQAYD